MPVACSASRWFGVTRATPLVEREVAHLGVHEHGDPPGGGRGRSRRLHEAGGDHSLLVVGDDEGLAGAEDAGARPRGSRSPRRPGPRSPTRGPRARPAGCGRRCASSPWWADPRRTRRGATRFPPAARRLQDAVARGVPADDSREHRLAPERADVAATLPAPPRWKLWSVTSTTGTGASGEMRATLPQMNSSSITSPTTSTRLPRMPGDEGAGPRRRDEAHAARRSRRSA